MNKILVALILLILVGCDSTLHVSSTEKAVAVCDKNGGAIKYTLYEGDRHKELISGVYCKDGAYFNIDTGARNGVNSEYYSE